MGFYKIHRESWRGIVTKGKREHITFEMALGHAVMLCRHSGPDKPNSARTATVWYSGDKAPTARVQRGVGRESVQIDFAGTLNAEAEKSYYGLRVHNTNGHVLKPQGTYDQEDTAIHAAGAVLNNTMTLQLVDYVDVYRSDAPDVALFRVRRPADPDDAMVVVYDADEIAAEDTMTKETAE